MTTDTSGEGHDLDTPQAVRQLVKHFYGQVSQDDLLGPMFNRIAAVDWNEHIDKLTNFWTRTLFGIGEYQANPLAAHKRVHDQAPFTAAHFHRWLELFADSVDRHFVGPQAEKTKRVAFKVAKLHSTRLLGSPVVADKLQESLLIIETKQPAA